MESDDLRGRLEDTPAAQVVRLQHQQLDRETRWEGYAAESDAQFVGIVEHATATNRCTQAARGVSR